MAPVPIRINRRTLWTAATTGKPIPTGFYAMGAIHFFDKDHETVASAIPTD